jgi:Mrp family chromosome partitioning ATPase
MSLISPYHPELDAIWQAISATGARSIAVVSALPREGASQIAVALARRAGQFAAAETLAQPGRPVAAHPRALLVDLDLLRPSSMRILGQGSQPDEIVRVDSMNLAVLGAIGPETANAWRERARLAEQLAAWRSEWSTVVLDAAPLLTVERRRGRRTSAADRRSSPDSGEIAGITAAAAADVCILVTLAGGTSGTRIREARDKLAAAGANLIGAILNDRDNPSLLAELDRETYRFAKYFPDWMAGLRARMHRSPILTVRV